MDQNFRDGVLPDFQEGTHNAYGVNQALIDPFEEVLTYIENDPDIQVVTFQQIHDEKLPALLYGVPAQTESRVGQAMPIYYDYTG